jgi:hypothetical protein
MEHAVTPPILCELLHELDAWLVRNAPLLEQDADEFMVRLRRFVTYVCCRSYRDGVRRVLERIRSPGEN